MMTKPLNKKPIIITLSVLLALVIIGFIVAWFIQSSDYATKYEELKKSRIQAVEDSIAKANDGLKALSTKPEPALAVKKLSETSKVISDLSDHLPGQEYFIVLPKLSSDKLNIMDDLKHSLQDFKASLSSAVGYIDYQKSVTKHLNEVKGMTGNNLTEQEVLAKAWKRLADKLNGLSAPQIAKQGHEKLVKSITEVSKILAQLPNLYKNEESTKFTSKQAEVKNKINRVKILSQDFKQYAIELDSHLSTRMNNLKATISEAKK